MAVEPSTDFHDWELLHESSESDSVISSDSFRDLEGFEGESQGMIQADYFSLDNCLKMDVSDQGSIQSDNPSWVDPDSEARFVGKEPWSDSGTDRSDDLKFGEFEGKIELGFVGNEKTLVGFEGIGEMNWSNNELGFAGNGKSLVGFEGIGEMSSPKNELSFDGFGKTTVGSGEIAEMESEGCFVGNGEKEAGFGGIEQQSIEFSEIGHASDVGKGISVISDVEDEKSSRENDVPIGEQSKPPMEVVKASGGGEKKKTVVWWKVPFEILRFCAFRVSPVWTFSMAAAFMGVVMLTRRLYMMKKKSQALKLKVVMNDKKVSQFMSRSARLNEAFSVVKRVPVIRPALSATGALNQYPAMNLR